LARHTTFLIKWWIVNPNILSFPVLTTQKITHYIEMLNSPSSQRNTQERVVVDTYMDTFQLQHHGLVYCHQQAIYLAERIRQNLEVNVQEHMYAKAMEYVNRQLSLLAWFKTVVKYLSIDKTADGEIRLQEYRARIRALKEDIRHGLIPDATPDERRLARKFLSILPPERLAQDDFDLALDLHKAPEAYIEAYCELNRLYEAVEYPLFNAVPLRRSHVQSSVHIDTTILHMNILGRPKPRLINSAAKRKWDDVLCTDKKIFKKYSGLEFGHSIYTDGVAVSISMQVKRWR
ncbi:hypothetical protein HKX48_003230, partial [Thoreauomyces humboldtii]